MIFDKLANTPVFSAVTGPGFNIGQSAYTLPDTATKIWHENRDGLHANYEQYFDNLIRKGDSTSWGINSSENYLNGIVISNSSTAANASEASGSNTRYLDIANQTLYHAVRHCWRQGCLQFFPEHQDFDAVDWFRVNQPYVFTSQGSSGSEGEEVQRCNEIVKALKPEVREWMIANQRVGDVVAYLMRSNLPGGYLEPKNHRPVVNMPWPSPEDLTLAASLTIETMPPTLAIKVISDNLDKRDSVRTAEVIGLKRVDYSQSRVLEVELTSNKPNVTFHWITGQGRNAITANGNRATITIPFQSNFETEAQDGHKLISNRMDVIAVAHDGTHYSCPVFISEYTTPEARALMPINTGESIKESDIGTLAYFSPESLEGNQAYEGSLGMDFTVLQDGLSLTSIGCFSPRGSVMPQGIEITVDVFDQSDKTKVSGASVKLNDANPGKMVEGTSHRVQVLPSPVKLKKNGKYTIVASGYRPSFFNGNEGQGSSLFAQENGANAISFDGSRYGNAREYPSSMDSKTSQYGAGTFSFVVGGVTPEPNPNLDQSAEVTRLKAELVLSQGNFSLLARKYEAKCVEVDNLTTERDRVKGLVNGFKTALNEILK